MTRVNHCSSHLSFSHGGDERPIRRRVNFARREDSRRTHGRRARATPRRARRPRGAGEWQCPRHRGECRSRFNLSPLSWPFAVRKAFDAYIKRELQDCSTTYFRTFERFTTRPRPDLYRPSCFFRLVRQLTYAYSVYCISSVQTPDSSKLYSGQ